MAKDAPLIVDTRGFFCPVPVIKVSDALRRIDAGRLVEIISDDPAIEFDLPAWCRSNGHTIRRSERQGDVFRYIVEKGTGQDSG